MKLFTEVLFPHMEKMVDHESKLLFMGSCFAEEIGGWLEGLKFDTLVNPLGITYNPVSIGHQLEKALGGADFTVNDSLEKDGSYFHPDYHSSLNQNTGTAFAKAVEDGLQGLRLNLESADFLFLTFGTAIAFEWKKTGKVINNCHRLPTSEFEKRMLNEEEMARKMMVFIDKITALNPKVHVVLTVSPIRHLRHGAVQNQRSKARLLRLCETLEEKFENCTYLPVYELVIDELRGYRFYRQDDLIHLNDGGLAVIKDRFSKGLIASESLTKMRKIEKWTMSMKHRARNVDSAAHLAFMNRLVEITEDLEKDLPGRFADELETLKSSRRDRQT